LVVQVCFTLRVMLNEREGLDMVLWKDVEGDEENEKREKERTLEMLLIRAD